MCDCRVCVFVFVLAAERRSLGRADRWNNACFEYYYYAESVWNIGRHSNSDGTL